MTSESIKRAVRRSFWKNEVAIVGTSTANLPTDTLVAPSTPSSRGDDATDRRKKKQDSESESPVLGIVRRAALETLEGEISPTMARCKGCNSLVMSSKLKEHVCDKSKAEGIEIQYGSTPANCLKVPNIKQTTSFCGPASLAAVLCFYGRQTTESEVAKLSGASHVGGVNVPGLMEAVRSFGLRPLPLQNGSREFVQDWVGNGKKPLFVMWYGHGHKGDGPHASVLVGFDDSSVYMMDPEAGMVVPKLWDKFIASWFTFDSIHPSKDGLTVGESLAIIDDEENSSAGDKP